MKKNYRFNKSTLVIAALVILAYSGLTTHASNGSGSVKVTSDKELLFFNQELTDEQKKGLEEARELFKSGDKEGAKDVLNNLHLEDLEWRAHLEEKMKPGLNKFMKKLSEEERETLKEVHDLIKEGNQEEAKALLKKLGLELPQKFQLKLEMPEEDKLILKEARKLMANGNKQAAMELLDQLDLEFLQAPFMNDLTDEQNTKVKEAHKLMLLGEKEGAKAILEEFDLPHQGKFIKMELSDDEKIRLKEAKLLLKTGNKDEAKAIFDELGLELPIKGMILKSNAG